MGTAPLPVTKSDYNELTDFLSHFEQGKRGRGFWRNRLSFWWDDNPAFSEDMERGWVLKDNDRIVGFFGIVPTRFQLSYNPITVFNSTTWRVMSEYRGKSLGLLAKHLNAAEKTILFATTPNAEVSSILDKFKLNICEATLALKR